MFSSLVSHVDGTMLEELRNRLAQMFIDSIQPYIRGEIDTPEKRASFYKN